MTFRTCLAVLLALIAATTLLEYSRAVGQETEVGVESLKKDIQQLLDLVESVKPDSGDHVRQSLTKSADALMRLWAKSPSNAGSTFALLKWVSEDILLRLDKQTNAEVRKELTHALFSFPWKNILTVERQWDALDEIEKSATARMTREPDVSIRQKILVGLALGGGPAVLAMLRTAIENDADARFLAVENLFCLSEARLSEKEKDEVRRLLLAGLSSEDETLRSGAAIGTRLALGGFMKATDLEAVLAERIEKESDGTIGKRLGELLSDAAETSPALRELADKVRRGEAGSPSVRLGVEMTLLKSRKQVDSILDQLRRDLVGTEVLPSARAAYALGLSNLPEAWQLLAAIFEKPATTEGAKVNRQNTILVLWLNAYEKRVDSSESLRTSLTRTSGEARIDEDFSRLHDIFKKTCHDVVRDSQKTPSLRALALIALISMATPRSYVEAMPITHEEWLSSTGTPLVMRKAALLVAARFWRTPEKDGKTVRSMIRGILDNPQESLDFKKYTIKWLTAMVPYVTSAWRKEVERILVQPPLGETVLDALVAKGLQRADETTQEGNVGFMGWGQLSSYSLLVEMGKTLQGHVQTSLNKMLCEFLTRDILSSEEVKVIVELYAEE